jgi:NAD(P)-dependent dehydrogenase (short-subunit alcohol dehydrogenase family)
MCDVAVATEWPHSSTLKYGVSWAVNSHYTAYRKVEWIDVLANLFYRYNVASNEETAISLILWDANDIASLFAAMRFHRWRLSLAAVLGGVLACAGVVAVGFVRSSVLPSQVVRAFPWLDRDSVDIELYGIDSVYGSTPAYPTYGVSKPPRFSFYSSVPEPLAYVWGEERNRRPGADTNKLRANDGRVVGRITGIHRCQGEPACQIAHVQVEQGFPTNNSYIIARRIGSDAKRGGNFKLTARVARRYARFNLVVMLVEPGWIEYTIVPAFSDAPRAVSLVVLCRRFFDEDARPSPENPPDCIQWPPE